MLTVVKLEDLIKDYFPTVWNVNLVDNNGLEVQIKAQPKERLDFLLLSRIISDIFIAISYTISVSYSWKSCRMEKFLSQYE